MLSTRIPVWTCKRRIDLQTPDCPVGRGWRIHWLQLGREESTRLRATGVLNMKVNYLIVKLWDLGVVECPFFAIAPPSTTITLTSGARNYNRRTHNSNLGRRSPGGGRVLCREYVPSRHIRSSGRALLLWQVNSASLMCDMNRWPSGRVSASA